MPLAFLWQLQESEEPKTRANTGSLFEKCGKGSAIDYAFLAWNIGLGYILLECPYEEAPVFARFKKSGKYQYLQIVENRKIKGKVVQRVIATIGRMDQLKEKNGIASKLLTEWGSWVESREEHKKAKT